MFQSWPHNVKWYILACLVSENHPKHGQQSYKIIIEDDLGLLGGLGVKNKSSVGSGLANSSFAFLSEILGSEKSSLVCHLWRAYHATSLCLVCLSDVRCTSSAAIAPGQMDMFFGDQTGIDLPRKCMCFFPRVLFSNVCLFAVPLMTATRIEDHHKNAQVKADVHEHIHSEPVEKSCCATWTAKTVDSPKHCWVKGSCFKWGQSSTARDYSTVDNEMCEGKDMRA